MDDTTLVRAYVDSAIADLRRRGSMRRPDPRMPAEMLDESIPARNGWRGWRSIESTVSDEELNLLETETGLKFPPIYRMFLKYRHFYTLTEMGCRFAPHVAGRWMDDLRTIYLGCQSLGLMSRGLLPFGDESSLDAGCVCFDTVRRDRDGDCPIVFWDHEWIGTDQEINPMFSSFRKMLESLLFRAQTDIDFVFADPQGDTPDTLLEKGRLLRRFLDIDPGGAGGPALGYWTCMGVSPIR